MGDRVWLSTGNFHLKGENKLKPKYVGPYSIVEVINPVAMKLSLPGSWKIHPVFHVSLLQSCPPSMRLSDRPLPVEVDGLEEYEVQSILDSRMVRGRIQYLVEWKGYGPEERTWEPVSNLNCPVLVDLFHEQHPGRPGRPPRSAVLERGFCSDYVVKGAEALSCT